MPSLLPLPRRMLTLTKEVSNFLYSIVWAIRFCIIIKFWNYIFQLIYLLMYFIHWNLSVLFAVALQALKQKKRLEAQQAQIDGQLTNIEMQREMLENAATNTQVLDAMQGGAKALKGVHKNMYLLFCFILYCTFDFYTFIVIAIWMVWRNWVSFIQFQLRLFSIILNFPFLILLFPF